MDFISPQAVLFQKQSYVPNVIFDYENLIRIDKNKNYAKNLCEASVFFDGGDGFSENTKISFTYESSVISSERIPVPNGTLKIRFDALENSYCAISNLKAFTNLGEIKFEVSNATLVRGDTCVFTHCDPWVIFNVENQPVMWIQFYADILVMKDANQLIFAKEYIENYKDFIRLAEELNNQSSVYDRKINELNAKLFETNSRLADTECKLQTANTELSEKFRRVEDLAGELTEKNSMIEELEGELKKKENELSLKTEELASSEESCTELSEALAEKNAENKFTHDELDKTSAELDHYKTHYFAAINQRTELRARVAELEGMYSCISRSACWKMTKPIRVILDIIKWPLRKIKLFRLIRKGIRCYRENGFKYTWRKFKEKLHRKKNTEIARRPLYTEKELEAQRKEIFSKDIKFSILVPLYNTPEKFLCEMIESVIAQTYSNWELCLADGSDNKHRDVMHIVKKYAKHDKRIKYKKLEKNLGISGNTNACIDMATGDYISLFDHDDLLHPAALHDVMVEICEKGADFIYTDENTFSKTPADAYCPHFKPDYAPDTLRSYNYICHFTSFKASLIDEVGKFRSEFDGSQDYDMILRLTERAQCISHIPKILYYWRCHANSVASDISAKPYTLTAAKGALDEHLKRVGLEGHATDARIPSTYKIEYEIKDKPMVSILIPNKDHIDDLEKCIDSVEKISTYDNYEIIVIENNSTETSTFDYYRLLEKKYDNVRVVEWREEGFNYSKINNFGFSHAKGEHIILMNNDIEPLTPSWIEEMLMYSQREDVGAVGMMLYYPDDTVQHAGVIIGIGGDPEMAVAGHSHKYYKRGEYGYASRLAIAQNLSAVTAACLMVRADVYREVEGLDESFAVAFNDVDFCLKIRKAGYLIVWTPFAEAYHYESKSRGFEDTREKVERFNREINNFLSKWKTTRDAGDPYYNSNLTLEKEDFSIKP